MAAGVIFFIVQSQRNKAAAEARAMAQAQRRADLITRFGGDIGARVLAHEIWVGQTAEQLTESRGEPVQVEEKVMKTKRREVWKYDQTSATRFNTRITIEDGIVTGWDQK